VVPGLTSWTIGGYKSAIAAQKSSNIINSLYLHNSWLSDLVPAQSLICKNTHSSWASVTWIAFSDDLLIELKSYAY